MRASFPKNQQRKFINEVLSEMSIKEASKLCGISERTIRDWRREKYLMDLKALHKLCKETNIPIPSNFKRKKDYWYAAKGGSTGGIAVLKKYGKIGGDSEYRKKKWYEWWENKGKYRQNFITKTKPIKKPCYSKKLAEFIGIVLGDGGISKRQVTVTLHHEDDKEYGKFVTSLIKNLFNVPVGIYHRKKHSIINYTISRTELVKFCTEKLGLKIGNKIKQQVDIPDWIKQNKNYSIACVRGLVDTDGSVFTHRYKVNNKSYVYKKLGFTSYSKPLRRSVFNILKNAGLNPRFARDIDVRLDSMENMEMYFRLIGSHNPKHLKNYVN